MPEPRIGLGFDAHRFGAEPPIVLGGVIVESERGVEATSDGDVVLHAVADAILGAANLGDLGMHFPSHDPAWTDADSSRLVETAVEMAHNRSVQVLAVDVTVISQSVHIAPFREAISTGVAHAVGIDPSRVSVKATTTDLMGAIGRDEGLAALAVVTGVTGDSRSA